MVYQRTIVKAQVICSLSKCERYNFDGLVEVAKRSEDILDKKKSKKKQKKKVKSDSESDDEESGLEEESKEDDSDEEEKPKSKMKKGKKSDKNVTIEDLVATIAKLNTGGNSKLASTQNFRKDVFCSWC